MEVDVLKSKLHAQVGSSGVFMQVHNSPTNGLIKRCEEKRHSEREIPRDWSKFGWKKVGKAYDPPQFLHKLVLAHWACLSLYFFLRRR